MMICSPGPRHMRAAILTLFLGLSACPAIAQTTVSDTLCDQAATRAAQDVGVPLETLRALTRMETGRSRNGEISPWPWTSNIAGSGRWYDSRTEALAHLDHVLRSGERQVDIGCFQLNVRWHGDRFSSLDDMLDPVQNATYAAQFLQRLHAEFGDWTTAIGAYHSRTHVHANRYLARYRQIASDLPPADVTPEMSLETTTDVSAPRALDGAARPSLWAGAARRPSTLLQAATPFARHHVRPLWGTAP